MIALGGDLRLVDVPEALPVCCAVLCCAVIINHSAREQNSQKLNFTRAVAACSMMEVTLHSREDVNQQGMMWQRVLLHEGRCASTPMPSRWIFACQRWSFAQVLPVP
jgi:hypothetical protein